MRIVIPIKQVPETNAVKMDPETGTMIREGVEAIINPLDLYAIEAGLQLREAHGGTVTVISMGPPKANKALREAMSMGCDDGVLLSDKAFAGSDTWATAYALAAAIRESGEFDLVLCGERATDGDTGQVGPGIAAFLDLPVATYVSRIQQAGDGILRVTRLIEEGYEVLEVLGPAVLTVVKEIAAPRLPTLRGKQRAKKQDIPVRTAESLQLEQEKLGLNGSPTRVVKIHRPSVTRDCQMHTATDEESVNQAADRLIRFLEEKDLL
ncbi:MAG: electron transfer flavoprotein subunit beta/FixA family protein [Phycisphaerae bacterium]